MPKKILLDTNFLLIPAQFGVDIYSEFDRIVDGPYALYTFSRVLEELDDLEKKGGRLRDQVKLTKAMLKSKGLNIIPLPSEARTVDEGLLCVADSIVATQDAAVKRALAAKHTPTITLRQRQYLILVN